METKTSKLYLSEELKRLTEENERLKERDTPRKVERYADSYDEEGNLIYDMAVCPECHREFEIDYDEHCDYCPDCGQKLDWSEVEREEVNRNDYQEKIKGC